MLEPDCETTYCINTEGLEQFFLGSRTSGGHFASDSFGDLNSRQSNSSAASIDENTLTGLHLTIFEQT